MHNKKITPRLSVLALAVAGALATQNAQALSFDVSDEATLDWDTTLAYTAAWRMSGQDDDLLTENRGEIGDDGNRNFEKGAMINNRFSVLTEMDFRYNNLGFFARGSAFYDGVYFGDNDNDSPGTLNSLTTQAGKFSDATKDTNGKDARLLDAFAYGNFEIGERNLSVRVGQQVVQWGESLFIPGVSAGQGPADGTKSNVAGVEVKDIYLPVGQIYAEFDITDNLSIGAYSQWEWKKTEIDSAGSYFSTSDLVDEGGETILTADQLYATNEGAALAGADPRVGSIISQVYDPITGALDPQIRPDLAGDLTLNQFSNSRSKDVDPSDSGQWGVAFNYYAENIGEGVDFGLYYLNYHEKEPKQLVFSDFYTPYTYTGTDPVTQAIIYGFPGTPGLNESFLNNTGPLAGSYHLEYFENIKSSVPASAPISAKPILVVRFTKRKEPLFSIHMDQQSAEISFKHNCQQCTPLA